jgi:CRISPR/Cas system type I-B associated protein Csh2 (Cas7 group RAMP superfamily)
MSFDPIATTTIAGMTTISTVIAQQLNSGTTLSLGEVITVFVFVGSLVAYLSRKLQKIEDDIQANTERLSDLERQLESRPCQKRDCNPL